jgi:hypothetical protein
MWRFTAVTDKRYQHVVLVTCDGRVAERGVVDGAEEDRTLLGVEELLD